jgi:hypothetical protein
MKRGLIRVGKTLQRLTVGHAVPAGSREVAVAFNFISERTVLCKPKTLPETASYNVLRLGNNVYILDRIYFLTCYPSYPSDPLAFYL